MTWLDDLVHHAQGLDGTQAQEALWARGASNDQIVRHQVGFLNSPLPSFVPKEFQLWWAGRKLDNAFLFPLTDALGCVRGFQFRSIDQAVRGYHDYVVDRNVLCSFGLGVTAPIIWAAQRAVLVEGVFDFFPVERVFPETAAVLGLSPSRLMLRFLRRMVSDIVLLADADLEGRRAVRRFQDHYGSEFRIHDVCLRVARKRGGMTKDPGELWEELGDAELRRLFAGAGVVSI
jgi:DNA primase